MTSFNVMWFWAYPTTYLIIPTALAGMSAPEDKIRKYWRTSHISIVFEINLQTNQVHCTVCSAVDQARAKWIARKGAKRHLDSAEHAENIKNSLRHQEAIASQQRQLQDSYSSLRPATINSFIPNTVPSTRANIFDDLPDLMHDNDNDYDDDNMHMFAPLDHPTIPAGVDPFSMALKMSRSTFDVL